MSATSGGGSVRVGGGSGGGSMSEGSEAGESSQSTMSITDSPSTSFQANHGGNINKISLVENGGSGAVQVDMIGSTVNLTLDERQTTEGVVNMGFDNDEGANRGDGEFKSINGSIKADKVSEAVNLELVNMVPYGNRNGTNYGVPVNGIPVKKDSEGGDISTPYDEYFVPVNEHKKYMRGEKLYVTKDKRRPASWRKCLSWIVACAVISIVLIVAILAGTGVILSQDANMVKEASVGRNIAESGTNSLVTNGSLSGSQDISRPGLWQSNANNMTHMFLPHSLEFVLPIDNLEWNSAYLDSNSTEYQQLLAVTENELKKILFDQTNFDPASVNLRMVNISNDPFKAVYRVGWILEPTANIMDPLTMEDVKIKLMQSLTKSQGFLHEYHIDLEKMNVQYIRDMCQINNWGCSHICFYNHANQEFTCACPESYVLDNSLKNCLLLNAPHVNYKGSVEQSYNDDDFRISDPDHGRSSEDVAYDHGASTVQDHRPSQKHGSDSKDRPTDGHGIVYEHDSAHGHGSHHEHETADEYPSTHDHGSDHSELEHNFHSVLTQHANAGYVPHSEERAHMDESSFDQSSPESAPKSNSESDFALVPEPTLSPSSGSDFENTSHHVDQGTSTSGSSKSDHDHDHIDPQSDIYSKTLTATESAPVHDHQTHIDASPALHDHQHSENEHRDTEFKEHNVSDKNYKQFPETTSQPTHDSTPELTAQPSSEHNPQSQSPNNFKSNLDSQDSSFSTPIFNDEHYTGEDHSRKFEKDYFMPPVSHMNGHDEKNDSLDVVNNQPISDQTTSHSKTGSHDATGHHVPLLEEILLEDSSRNSTEENGGAKSNVFGHSLSDNVGINGEGESVAEGSVIDKSSPQTEPNYDHTSMPHTEGTNKGLTQDTEYKTLREESPAVPQIHEESTQTYNVGESSTEEGPLQIDYSNMKDHNMKQYNVTQKPMKNKFDDQHSTVVIPGQNKAIEIENGTDEKRINQENDFVTALLDSKHEGNQTNKENAPEDLMNVPPGSVSNMFGEEHVQETTQHPEEKSSSTANTPAELSVDEPEPKIKTRISNQPIASSSDDQFESHTDIPKTVPSPTEATEEKQSDKGGSYETTVSPIMNNNSPKPEQDGRLAPVSGVRDSEETSGYSSSSGLDGLRPSVTQVEHTTPVLEIMGNKQIAPEGGQKFIEDGGNNNSNHKQDESNSHTFVHAITQDKPQDTEKDVKRKENGMDVSTSRGQNETHQLEGQEPKTMTNVFETDSNFKETHTTSEIEMTTMPYEVRSPGTSDSETLNTKEGTAETTKPYSVLENTDTRHLSSQINPDNVHSDDFTNNIKDEGVDNDEFNTLLGKEYKNEYSNDAKDVFNKYTNKQTFLKGDKKKLKDFGKPDKTETDKKPIDVTTKPYEKDFIHQSHDAGSSFGPNLGVIIEHTTAKLKETTRNSGFSSIGIPVQPYNVYNSENPDFRLLHTVSPGSEDQTHAQDDFNDGDDEGSILKTYSTDDGFNSKEEEYKSEKDFPKQDKDHKYDKQKGGKKKDLKKKGSSKDGKNVEVDDSKRYYTEVPEERSVDEVQENPKGLSNVKVTPHDKVQTDQMQNEDESNVTVQPNGKVAPEYVGNPESGTTWKPHGPESELNPDITTHYFGNNEGFVKNEMMDKMASGSGVPDSGRQLTVDPTNPNESKYKILSTTNVPKHFDGTVSQKNHNMKQLQGPHLPENEKNVKDINDSITEPQKKEEDVNHHNEESSFSASNSNGFATENKGSDIEDHRIHTIGSATSQNINGDQSPTLQFSDVSYTTTTQRVGDDHASQQGTVTLSEIDQEYPSTIGVQNTEKGKNPTIIKNIKTDQSVKSEPGSFIHRIIMGENVANERSPVNEGSVVSGRIPNAHEGLVTSSYDSNGSNNNRDSIIYSITNSSGGHPTVVLNGEGVQTYNSPIYSFEGGKFPFRRILNVTNSHKGDSSAFYDDPVVSGNTTGIKFNPFFRGQGQSDAFYNGQEFRYNTTHTFVPPPVNFNGSFGGASTFRLENGSLPGTVFDGRFNPQEGHYHMYTNSSGTYAYSGGQPSFKIKGESGDFGRSSVYILGNNSGSTAISGNSSNPLKSHHVIFRNSTVFAVRNISDGKTPNTVEVQQTFTIGNSTIKKGIELTPSSLASGIVYKVGEHLGYVSKCATGQYQCLNGTSKRGSACINLSSKCDSINDCLDGSDEAGCIENGCPGNFQCSDGTCLKRHLVCNGIVECSDGSDEKLCEHWKCKFDEFKCPSGRCIPVLWQCDGKADCDNHTDEQNCQRSCGNDEYLCPEGWCVPLTYRCNGIKECSNGEDEQLCDCSIDEFKCQSGGCVPKEQVCNGLDECPDRSDEWDCMRIQPNSTLLEIRSSSGEFQPVCADNWSAAFSDHVCASFGYSSAIEVESATVPFANEKSFYMLNNVTVIQDDNVLVNLMKTNKTCSSKKWVEISCQEFTCGSHSMTDSSSAEGRLVGGMGATAGQWPSVSLLYNVRNMHTCTANVLTPRWVLASYNCLKMGNKNLNEKDWKLYVGSTVFEPEKENGETRKILAVIPHPQVKFNQFLFSNDLALVKTDEPLSFSSSIGAVCLPEQNIQPRQICVTAGWGLDGPEDKSIRQQLQYLPVPTMNLTDCNSTEHYSGFVPDDKICAGHNAAEKSLCYNEEGAPLMCVNDRGEWELQGMLSYHSNCGRGSHPSIFSSIKTVKDWIRQTIGNSVDKRITSSNQR